MFTGTIRNETKWLQAYLQVPVMPAEVDEDIDPRFWWLDQDTGHIYTQEPSEGEDGTPPEWTDGGVPLPPGSVPPGDGVAPQPPTSFVVTTENAERDDGTVAPILRAAWVNSMSTDVIGYELQWDRSDPDSESDPDNPIFIPPDWLEQHTLRADADVKHAILSDVLGGAGYVVRIRSYDIDGLQSDPWTVHVRVEVAPDTIAPDVPEAPTAIGGYKLISAYWARSEAIDLAFYQLRYRPEGGTDEDWVISQTKSNRVTISDLLIETSYEVEVRAVDRSGNVATSEVDPTAVNYSNEDVGWSGTATATTLLVGSEDVAVHTLAAAFVNTGVLDANRIIAGSLKVGGVGDDSSDDIRIFDDAGRPIASQGGWGILMVNPNSTNEAMHLESGIIEFTDTYEYPTIPFQPPDLPDGNTPAPYIKIEEGISPTRVAGGWTAAMGPQGINAEAIRFGSQLGGNNRILNAGFELQDFDTAALVEDVKTDAATFGTGRYTGADINLDVSGTELRMSAH